MQTSSYRLVNKRLGSEYTEYQLHKSQISNGIGRNIFDYTEYRFLKYMENFDNEKQLVLINVLTSYRKGSIAISWKSGEPVWVSVNKE
jgi:glycosylphosphatidylinositol transamidase (GPIT) subunit GPI8